MKNKTLKERIFDYPRMFTSNGNLNWQVLKSDDFNSSKLKQDIINRTPFLKNPTINERIYCIKNDITERITCKICDNDVKFKKGKYQLSCSSKCNVILCLESKEKNNLKKYGTKNYVNLEKRKQTNLKKYGVKHVLQSKEIQEKMQENNLKKYGVKHVLQSKEIQEKMQENNLKKYGVKHVLQIKKVRDKSKETCIKKYGTSNPLQSKEILEKQQKTMIDRYGAPYPLQSKEILEKQQNTIIDKYGVENAYQSEEVKNKIKSLFKDKHGVEHNSQVHLSKSVLDKLNDKEYLIEQHHKQKKTLVQIAHELEDISPCTVGNYLRINNIDINVNNGQSLPEKLLVEYIEENYGTEIITNDRTLIKPREIDIYLPEYKLAIEFNGIYWHHPDRYDSINDWENYHKSKVDECKSQGITLLHLWENYGDHFTLIDEAISGNINNNLELILESVLWDK